MKRCRQIEIKTEMKNVFLSYHGPLHVLLSCAHRKAEAQHAHDAHYFLHIQGHCLTIYTLPGQAFPSRTPNLAQGANFSKYSQLYTGGIKAQVKTRKRS